MDLENIVSFALTSAAQKSPVHLHLDKPRTYGVSPSTLQVDVQIYVLMFRLGRLIKPWSLEDCCVVLDSVWPASSFLVE